MVTSFVPSGNVPSTSIASIISITPSNHGVERKNRRPRAHDLGDRLAVRDELEDFRGDQRHRFRMIELQATAAALLASSPVVKMRSLSISRGGRCTASPLLVR